MIRVRVAALGLDSTRIGCMPTARALLKKRPAVHRQVPGRVERQASYGCGCPNSRGLRALPRPLLKRPNRPALVMDRACEDNEARQLAADPGFTPVAPPKSSRIAIRTGSMQQAAQRGRTPVLAAQGLSQDLRARCEFRSTLASSHRTFSTKQQNTVWRSGIRSIAH